MAIPFPKKSKYQLRVDTVIALAIHVKLGSLCKCGRNDSNLRAIQAAYNPGEVCCFHESVKMSQTKYSRFIIERIRIMY
jgi:predicted GTPase